MLCLFHSTHIFAPITSNTEWVVFFFKLFVKKKKVVWQDGWMELLLLLIIINNYFANYYSFLDILYIVKQLAVFLYQMWPIWCILFIYATDHKNTWKSLGRSIHWIFWNDGGVFSNYYEQFYINQKFAGVESYTK